MGIRAAAPITSLARHLSAAQYRTPTPHGSEPAVAGNTPTSLKDSENESANYDTLSRLEQKHERPWILHTKLACIWTGLTMAIHAEPANAETLIPTILLCSAVGMGHSIKALYHSTRSLQAQHALQKIESERREAAIARDIEYSNNLRAQL